MMMITVSANPNLFKLLPPPNLSSSFCIISKTKAFSFPLCSGNLQILNSSWRRDALRSPRAAASISGSAEAAGGFDPELRLVLELATDSELYEIESILFGTSYFSPLLKSITNRADVDITHGGEYEGREDFIEHLESRFLFLAADARSTLRGWRPSYRSVLLDVRRKLKIPCTSKLSTEDLEAEIFLHLLQEYSSEESGSIPFSSNKFADSNSPGSLEVGLGPWKHRALSILKVGAEELRSMILKCCRMSNSSCVNAIPSIPMHLDSHILGWWYVDRGKNLSTARKLSGRMLSEAANYQIKREILKKGGQLAAINLESRTALLAARKGFACAASRYLGLRSLMMLLGPVLWGTFLADVVIQMIGTDYARILRAIYAFAQIRLTRTYGWVSNKNHLAKKF